MFRTVLEHDYTYHGRDFIVVLYYKGKNLNKFGKLIDIRRHREILKGILTDVQFEPSKEKLAIFVHNNFMKFKFEGIEVEKVRVYKSFRKKEFCDYWVDE